MRPILTASVFALSISLLSACGGGDKENSQVAETRMDDIDSLEGTISDDMINTDESTEEGVFDAPATADPKLKAKADDDQETKNDGVTKATVDDEAKTE